MARYQMSYGVTDEIQTVAEKHVKSKDEAVEPEQKPTQEKKAPKPPCKKDSISHSASLQLFLERP